MVTGVSPRLLRYYEEQGLLSPERSATGQRLYIEADFERVARIRRLLSAGLSTAVIAQILACVCGGTGDVEPCLDPLLMEELDRIDSQLAQLTEHRRRLTTLVGGDEAVEDEPVDRDPALLLKVRRSESRSAVHSHQKS
ncbi:MerR family transcriptional regulator [Glycomyces tarimensis]